MPYSVPMGQYKCDGCGVSGCKLWRPSSYQGPLRCAECAAKAVGLSPDAIGEDGRHVSGGLRTDQLYSENFGATLLPCVPTQDGKEVWGYTSIPSDARDWWTSLPLRGSKASGRLSLVMGQ